MPERIKIETFFAFVSLIKVIKEMRCSNRENVPQHINPTEDSKWRKLGHFYSEFFVVEML